MQDPTIPNGVIFAPLPTDYVRGDGKLNHITALRNFTSDWTPYVPKGERQSGNGFDSNDCTGFGYTNVVETQFKYFKINGKISVEALKFLNDNGYLDENGEANFSDRALGSMAGTTSAGNALNVVAETARTKGLVPESKWPSVFTNYAEYYKPVPQDLIALGKRFLEFFEVPYHQVTSDFDEAIKDAPLYVALCTCGGWNNPQPPPVAWCNAGNATNHCVCLLKTKDYRIFDSYLPFVKDFASNYNIPYFYQVLFNPKTMIKKFIIQDGAKLGVLVLEGFTGTIAFADTATHFQELKDAFGFTGTEKTIVIPQA